jgi:hypothetical protein
MWVDERRKGQTGMRNLQGLVSARVAGGIAMSRSNRLEVPGGFKHIVAPFVASVLVEN